MAAGTVAIVLLVGALLGAPSAASGGQEGKEIRRPGRRRRSQGAAGRQPEDHLQSERVPPTLRVLREPRAGIPETSRSDPRSTGLTLEEGRLHLYRRRQAASGNRIPRRRELNGGARRSRAAADCGARGHDKRSTAGGLSSRVLQPSNHQKFERWRVGLDNVLQSLQICRCDRDQRRRRQTCCPRRRT